VKLPPGFTLITPAETVVVAVEGSRTASDDAAITAAAPVAAPAESAAAPAASSGPSTTFGSSSDSATPGPKYARTRHNIGFIVVEELARRWHLEGWTKTAQCAAAARPQPPHRSSVEPLAYMNESGPPTLGVATFYKVPPPRILVIVDDLDLPFARLRLRMDGSSGGHNGLKSSSKCSGTGFPRLRIGIGRDRESSEAIRHVLGAFSPEENAALPAVIDRCIEGIESWLRGDIQGALNRINAANAKRNEAEEPKDG